MKLYEVEIKKYSHSKFFNIKHKHNMYINEPYHCINSQVHIIKIIFES